MNLPQVQLPKPGVWEQLGPPLCANNMALVLGDPKPGFFRVPFGFRKPTNKKYQIRQLTHTHTHTHPWVKAPYPQGTSQSAKIKISNVHLIWEGQGGHHWGGFMVFPQQPVDQAGGLIDLFMSLGVHSNFNRGSIVPNENGHR